MVIVGSSVGDNRRVDVERGIVRAYDARSGAQRWAWDPLPSGSPAGAANAWSPISSDPAMDLVFIPTGSASPDFYLGQLIKSYLHWTSTQARNCGARPCPQARNPHR